MLKLVIDTNVVISALLKQESNPALNPEICRGCFKRTDGKVDYLINGFC